MDDLVDRLRTRCDCEDDNESCARCRQEFEAADEIDKLRVKLDTIRDWSGCPPDTSLKRWLEMLYHELGERRNLADEIERLKSEVDDLRERYGLRIKYTAEDE